MKEVCLLNQGENLKKIVYSLNLKIDLSVKEEKLLDGHRCIVLKEGSDDIVIVRNYNPYFVKKISNDETMLDIYAQGYDLIGAGEYNNDYVILNKTSGIKYCVKPLESLEDISHKFGVSKDNIIQTNSLKSEKLFIGQILII